MSRLYEVTLLLESEHWREITEIVCYQIMKSAQWTPAFGFATKI